MLKAHKAGAGLRHARWLMSLATLGLALLLSSCVVGVGGTIGSGTSKTETRSVSGFTRVIFSGVGTLNIAQTGTESLMVSADDNVLPLLTSSVSGSTLTLGVKPGNSINPKRPIIYTLTVKRLTSVELSGAGVINAVGITTDALSVTLSGAGNMTVTGSARAQTVIASGVGSYSAKDFQTATTQVTSSGAGNAVVSASQTLSAVISGAGSVTYYGSPQVTQVISGAGSIKHGS